MDDEMQFKIEFQVGESDLGHVMAALYRKGARIRELGISPFEDAVGQVPVMEQSLSSDTIEAVAKALESGKSQTPKMAAAKAAKGGKMTRRNTRPKGQRLSDSLIALMKKGPAQTMDMHKIANNMGYAPNGLFSCLERMIKRGEVVKLQSGLYGLATIMPEMKNG